MTTVVAAGRFNIRPADVERLRDVAPDLESIEVVDTLTQLRDQLARPGSHVGIVHGELDQLDVAAVTRELTVQETTPPFLVTARTASGEQVARALGEGARGFLLTDSPVEELITAVRALAAGYLYIPSAYVNDLAGTLLLMANRQHNPAVDNPLTQREHDVLSLLTCGLPNSEIAQRLYISEATVRTHVLNLLRKLNVRNRTEAVVLAYQLGLLQPPSASPPVSVPAR